MADTVTLPGTGAVVASDEVTIGGTAQQVQRVKLVDGTDGGTELLPGTAARGLAVDPRVFSASQSQDSSGLTTASTAYTAGDVLGAGWTFTTMARTSGGLGRITGAALLDDGDVTIAVDLFLASASITFGTDNAAPSVSDADAAKIVGIIGVSMTDLGGSRVGVASGLSVPYLCDATSLFVYAVTRTAHTFFAAADDLHLRLFYEQD